MGERESLGELLHSVSAWGLGLVTVRTIPVSHVLSLPGTSLRDFSGKLKKKNAASGRGEGPLSPEQVLP